MKVYDYDEKSGVALPENVIECGNVRLTLLSDRLLRYEFNEQKRWTDETTQGVWKRSFAPVEKTVKISAGKVTIKTESVTFIVDLQKFENGRVKFADGKSVSFCAAGNLGGALRTLDTNHKNLIVNGVLNEQVDRAHVKLKDGVVSKSGVAVLDDSESLIIENDKVREREQTVDKYVFAFGHDYRAAVNAFYDISGKVPLVPRFALGNWWSRYYPYEQNEYINLMDEFAERKIPLAVATVDMDWHYVDVYNDFIAGSGFEDKEVYGSHSGWTGYTWNKKLFYDYKKFLKDLKSRGLKITLNLHPSDGIRWFEEQYKEFAENMGMNPEEKKVIPFDITDDKFVENYFNVVHAPYVRDGVDFWWIDWQQGYNSKIKGLDPLWLLNHLHYKHSAEEGTPLILSRYCGAGAQRYPLGFSGDTAITWTFLDYQPYFTATGTNVGYTWWSHDIGGHHLGGKDNELAVRWVQFGVFSPINRLHSCTYWVSAKEPWRYRDGVGEILCEQLRFRHKLVPFIHTYNHLTHECGKALIEPLYYTYPEEKWAYRSFNQYFFGNEMLVCPITKKGKNKIGVIEANVPQGAWIDLFTRRLYSVKEGVKRLKLYRDLGSIPVLVKEGSIIPLSEDEGNGCANPENLRVLVFGERGSFTMIEDDGHSARLETSFSVERADGTVKFTCIANGDKSVAPAKRRVTIEFATALEGEVLSVCENGKPVDYSVRGNGCLKVFTEYCGGKLEVAVRVKKSLLDAAENSLEYVKRQSLSVIERQDYGKGAAMVVDAEKLMYANDEKEYFYLDLLKTQTVEEFFAMIDATKILTAESKAAIREIYEALA